MSTEAQGKVTPPGLTQPPSQNPKKEEKDTNPVPVSIRGHKAVPVHPEARLSINPQYKGNADGNPKTMQQCVDEYNAKNKKAEPVKPVAPVTPDKK